MRAAILRPVGLLDLDGMITQRIALDDVDEALNALGRADIIRQVIIC